MKIDWKARCKAERKEHKELMKKLRMGYLELNFAEYDVANQNYGEARNRIRRGLEKVAKIIGAKYTGFDTLRNGPKEAWK